MKKIIMFFLAAILTLTVLPARPFVPAKENPAPAAVVVKPNETAVPAEVKALKDRLDEIRAMDLKKMNASEKKDLRKEVRTIKRELKDISGGVYISAGALILILILLILLT